ncbi:MAG: hypothetical protein US83_C0009G0013 [Candidatus Falkowbacteria bacterium GW2011_GWC2_38_22]|uniref:Uncharacterized protein n=1 Tax=Candidatus Falkowbacteria bacterium GW2011_GWE1_38_31 TaxID=1618638 RepID=A0A0G0M8E6_9BACT|nr:MAG: hypothetical protein US73_C0012G0013 [Candidatus Falkowbacteria bacterium GW2011_GWF2_38_1205]KKQ61107.1 MAG: hypothetical protein US83_C0009G0013 [Candidatus Falkowbacteria bacterium GW2011_GWC2_38_22]KKQ63177.1 MAG: hypothetical protein US84_C0008G0070 [Candidatus Falkowbacteria bacterium GW2011_GWF1_38_22]KKQ65372.1 MAG: hypothetical protein US87_C0008G0068 [Candidatus Falkowbacteria bacterium GW2011_GWE2_38_254]KKQ69949.1 MAG: hypothetical protein US91_C0008G0069 [Candidatus Falkowb
MLTQKVNKKKNQVMMIAILLICVIVAAILLKNYVFKGGSSNDAEVGAVSSINSNILKEAPKSFDAEFLKSETYQSLVDNNIKIKEIDELKVGNKNPFAVEEKK